MLTADIRRETDVEDCHTNSNATGNTATHLIGPYIRCEPGRGGALRAVWLYGSP